MTRVKRGNVARLRRKKILKIAKGFRGAQSKQFRKPCATVIAIAKNANAISAACGLLGSMRHRACTARVTANSLAT